MADEPSCTTTPPPLPQFLEVVCKISGKNHRFATGTKAEFAVSLINGKLGFVNPRVVYIEAVKEGEEPISFGPDAVLVDYGHGWKLKTVIGADYPGTENRGDVLQQIPVLFPSGLSRSNDSNFTRGTQKPETKGGISLMYIGKILIAFVLMFVLGALFTIALENLPGLILLVNSSL